jgi:hypothetical protein
MRAQFVRHSENPLDTLNIGRVDEREVKDTMALFVKNYHITEKIEEYRIDDFYDNEFTEDDYLYYLGISYEEGKKKYTAGVQELSGPRKNICEESHYASINSAYFSLAKYYENYEG